MNTKEKYQAFVNTAFLAAVEPVVIERAKGATYIDEDGTNYIDCFSGIAVANAGHGNEAVIKAAKEQMMKAYPKYGAAFLLDVMLPAFYKK